MFTVGDREATRDRILELAASDRRVVAGALLGSLTEGGDRWSDLDLSFAVDDGIAVTDVLEDWTRSLGAVRLFDLPVQSTVYRVLLFPGCLQVDLSFTPAARFGARGPKFELLFGESADLPHTPPPAADELLGLAVHHALRARFAIERGRFWHAEYWTSAVRDYALALACRRRGLPAVYGRGFDDLPAEALAPFEHAIVRAVERDELLRALRVAVSRLIEEAVEAEQLLTRVEPQLRELVSAASEDAAAS